MKTTEKICKNHGLTIFVVNTENVYRCKKCRVDAVTRRRRKIKKQAVEYLGGKCMDCSLADECYDIYDFHHEGSKDFAISQRGHSRSWDRVKKELNKCVLLCSNCHRKRHSSR